MTNPKINTQINDSELTDKDLYPVLNFVTPIRYSNQDQGLWYGFYTMMQRLLEEDYIEEDYIPEIEEMFGEVPDDEKFNWMRDYEATLAQSSLFGTIAQVDLEQQQVNDLIDDIFSLIPDDRKVEFLELLFEGNIPPELASQIEYTPETVSPEDVISKYRENGLTLGSGDRSTFANNNRVAMTTEELAGLLDKMSGINQELKTQIQEQPVINTSVVGEPSVESENPFMAFGDKIGRVIDSQIPKSNQNLQKASTTVSPLPTVQQPTQRVNQNLVNQPAFQPRNQIPGQPFTLPSIPSGGNTISRLTQARRASTGQSQSTPVVATSVSPSQTPQITNPQPTVAPATLTQPNSTAQMLKEAIRAKKIAAANQTPQPIRPNRPPSVSL